MRATVPDALASPFDAEESTKCAVRDSSRLWNCDPLAGSNPAHRVGAVDEHEQGGLTFRNQRRSETRISGGVYV